MTGKRDPTCDVISHLSYRDYSAQIYKILFAQLQNFACGFKLKSFVPSKGTDVCGHVCLAINPKLQ